MNRAEAINFITRPDLLSENASDMQLLFAFKSIVMDYARLSDPFEKAANSFFIIHAEEAMPIDNEEIYQDFMFVKDFFFNKYASDISKDMLNIMQNPAIIQLKYEKMEAAFKKLL